MDGSECAPAPPAPVSLPSPPSLPPGQAPSFVGTIIKNRPKGCFFCSSVENLKTCTGCHSAYYCSAEHQRKDWKSHRNECRDLAALQEAVLKDTKMFKQSMDRDGCVKLIRKANRYAFDALTEPRRQLKLLNRARAVFFEVVNWADHVEALDEVGGLEYFLSAYEGCLHSHASVYVAMFASHAPEKCRRLVNQNAVRIHWYRSLHATELQDALTTTDSKHEQLLGEIEFSVEDREQESFYHLQQSIKILEALARQAKASANEGAQEMSKKQLDYLSASSYRRMMHCMARLENWKEVDEVYKASLKRGGDGSHHALVMKFERASLYLNIGVNGLRQRGNEMIKSFNARQVERQTEAEVKGVTDLRQSLREVVREQLPGMTRDDEGHEMVHGLEQKYFKLKNSNIALTEAKAFPKLFPHGNCFDSKTVAGEKILFRAYRKRLLDSPDERFRNDPDWMLWSEEMERYLLKIVTEELVDLRLPGALQKQEGGSGTGENACEEWDEEARKKMQELLKAEYGQLQETLGEIRDQSLIFLEVVEFELKDVLMAALQQTDAETWSRSAVELARCYLSSSLSAKPRADAIANEIIRAHSCEGTCCDTIMAHQILKVSHVNELDLHAGMNAPFCPAAEIHPRSVSCIDEYFGETE